MKVSRPGSQILVLTECRRSHIENLTGYLLFFACWYCALLDLGKIPDGVHPYDHLLDRLSAEPFLWLFVLGPLILVGDIFESLWIAVMGEEFTFNGMTRTVLKNQKRLVGFDEIAYLQIRTIRGAEDAEHILTAVLQTRNKIEIDTSWNESDIIALADDVADILGVKLIRLSPEKRKGGGISFES